MSVVAHVALATGIALAIVLLARQAHALSLSGAGAAFIVGTLALAAGWRWGVLLVAYFVTSSALSGYRRATKEARVSGIVAKGGERDAVQVISNGGVFALSALLLLVHAIDQHTATAIASGALAASASDTWATEVGTLAPTPPRSIVSWQRVPPGSSGGVTLLGTLAALAGAGFVALTTYLVGWTPAVAGGAFAGGLAGSTVDSLLGATLQEKRWCDRCGRPTERTVHGCGQVTRRIGGIPSLRNDVVNLVCSAVGGLLAVTLAK